VKPHSTADAIRDHIRNRYINPARARREPTIRIVAGDVHRALRLHNRVPAVCQVLRGRMLLEENGLVIEKQEGPPSGLGTTVAVVYRFEDPSQEHPQNDDSAWQSLRGIARGIFPGGAEKFLRAERRSFHAPGHDPLNESGSKS
jgi:hypothetical protein